MVFDTHLEDVTDEDKEYAVRLMVEDLDENRKPRSKVSLSFLYYVSPDTSTCEQPIFVEPSTGICDTIKVGDTYTNTIKAQSANG